MDAQLILDKRDTLSDDAFQQLVVWLLPKPLYLSTHFYKYRLALIVDKVCVMRYDNEAGKGDHKHIGDEQFPVDFAGLPTLLADFDADVERWFNEHGRD